MRIASVSTPSVVVVSGVAPLQIEKLKWWFSPSLPFPFPSLLLPFLLRSVSPEFCARSHPGVKCERKWIGREGGTTGCLSVSVCV